MYLCWRINFFIVFLRGLNFKSANTVTVPPAQDFYGDVPNFMDYGSTTKWTPRLETIPHEKQQHTGLSSRKPSIGKSNQNPTFSPDEALRLAKLMVLPVSDAARQQAMKSYGTDTIGMERMMGQWMKDHVYGTFMQPMNLNLLRKEEKYIVLESLLTTPGSADLTSTLNQNLRLDLPAAKFWEVGNPEARPFATYVPMETNREAWNMLEDPYDWQHTRPPITAAVPSAAYNPAFTKAPKKNTKPVPSGKTNASQKVVPKNTTPKQNVSKNTPPTNPAVTKAAPTKEAFKNPVPTKATFKNAAPTKPALKNAAPTKAEISHAARLEAARADAIKSKINSLIEDGDNAERMYDYKSPTWDEMPKLQAFVTTTTSSTTTIAHTLFPSQPPQHPMVARAHQQMWTYNMRYLSAFMTTLCEIIGVSKDGHAKKLGVGLEAVVTMYVQEGWLAALGQTTLSALEEYVQRFTTLNHEQVENEVDAAYVMFRNHSYFRNDTQAILREIESWYTIEEGENLLKTIETVADWPHQGKKHGTVCKEVIDALLAPYMRMGQQNSRRQRALASIDKAIASRYGYNRRHLISNHTKDNKQFRVKSLTSESYSDSESRMEKERNVKAKIRFEIVNNKNADADDYYHKTKEENENRAKNEIYNKINKIFNPNATPAAKRKGNDKVKEDVMKDVNNYLHRFTSARDYKNNKNHHVSERYFKRDEYTIATSQKDEYNRISYQNYNIEDELKKSILNRLRVTLRHKDYDEIKRTNYIVKNHMHNKHSVIKKNENEKKTEKDKSKVDHSNSDRYYNYMYSEEKPEGQKHHKLHRHSHSKHTRNKYKYNNDMPKPHHTTYYKIYTHNLQDDLSDTFERYDIRKKINEHENEASVSEPEHQYVFNDKHKHHEEELKLFPITKQRIIEDYYDSKSKERVSLLRGRDLDYGNSKRKEDNNKKYTRITQTQKYNNVNPLQSNNKQTGKDKFDDVRNLMSEYKKSQYMYAALNSKEDMDENKKLNQRFYENFKSKQVTKNNNSKNFPEESSYSDAELDIKLKLGDALRHGDGNFSSLNNNRRSLNLPREKTIRDGTSESNEEGILKNNIYRAFGYNFSTL